MQEGGLNHGQGRSWPKKRRLLGTKVPRLDGPEKATGRAKYSYDINRPGMLHAEILRSPHAHAKIKSDRHLRRREDARLQGAGRHRRRAATGSSSRPMPATGTLELRSIPNKKKKEKEEKRTVKVGPGVTLISQEQGGQARPT